MLARPQSTAWRGDKAARQLRFARSATLAYAGHRMAYDDDDNRGSGQTGSVLKGVLMTLGALMALSIAFSVGIFLVKNVLLFGLLGGAGYLGYRMIAGGGNRKQITGGRSQRALGRGRGGNSSDDFERKMRELDAIEKRLDAEIGKR